jgi:hypothetical protein
MLRDLHDGILPGRTELLLINGIVEDLLFPRLRDLSRFGEASRPVGIILSAGGAADPKQEKILRRQIFQHKLHQFRQHAAPLSGSNDSYPIPFYYINKQIGMVPGILFKKVS